MLAYRYVGCFGSRFWDLEEQRLVLTESLFSVPQVKFHVPLTGSGELSQRESDWGR
jgi:hypothetical protein